jgi:hypothetical protein
LDARTSSPFQKGFFLGSMGEKGGLVAFKGEGMGQSYPKYVKL